MVCFLCEVSKEGSVGQVSTSGLLATSGHA
jgi:hypothetical protein